MPKRSGKHTKSRPVHSHQQARSAPPRGLSPSVVSNSYSRDCSASPSPIEHASVPRSDNNNDHETGLSINTEVQERRSGSPTVAAVLEDIVSGPTLRKLDDEVVKEGELKHKKSDDELVKEAEDLLKASPDLAGRFNVVRVDRRARKYAQSSF